MTTKVKQWDRFETMVENDRHYRDAYRDVTLTVTVTKPNGEIQNFWGFYDGGTTWRFRYMPDQLGAWSYRGAFSDGSVRIEGQFECIASDLPGVIGAYGENPVWFGYRAVERRCCGVSTSVTGSLRQTGRTPSGPRSSTGRVLKATTRCRSRASF